MLQGNLPVTDYMHQMDAEYPEFTRRMCHLLRELYAAGKVIHQVEPFLEVLLGIHDFFADGHGPDELDKKSIQYPVYLAERNATAALLDYYRTVLTESFEKTVDSILQFARVDAARFQLRDSLRAQELAQKVMQYPSSYIEAGMLHFSLWRQLRQSLPPQVNVRPIFHANTAMTALQMSGHLYGPGDQLTLLYEFHPNMSETRSQRELAARSIIYAKIIKKEEISINNGNFPHIRDELLCNRMTRQLNLDDCRKLFPLIRRVGTSEARLILADYLSGTGRKVQRPGNASSSKQRHQKGHLKNDTQTVQTRNRYATHAD